MLMRACRQQDHDEDGEDLLERDRVGEVQDQVEAPEVEQGRGELGAEPVDRGHDGDQPEQVEPAREPRPDRAAELVRPPVGTAGGRIGRGHLRHAEGDGQDDQADDRPAPGDRDRSAEVPRLRVGREAPGQDRDDRERDREVRELGPAAGQLLLVAQLGEALLVAVDASAAFRHPYPPRVRAPVAPSHRPHGPKGLTNLPSEAGPL